MAQLGNLLVKGSSRFLNKAYFEDVYICGDVSTGGKLDITANEGKSILSLNGKKALEVYDTWLNINESGDFTAGIYCGSGVLRTDGEFQVSNKKTGVKFKVNNSSLASYVPSTFSAQATFNGGFIASSANISEEICNTLIVKDELRSAKWSIDNITNLGSTFYVSPCIIFTNPSVYVNSISGTTVVLTITDNSITSSTIGGATWTNGSKIKLMGRIGNSALGTINGVLKRDLNSSTAKTAYISLDFPNTNLIKFSAGATYSGSNVGDLKMMMYEVNKNVNGTTKNRPIGILLSSYGENKKPCIDIYNGDIEDGSPVVRMGYLNGLPSVNGVNPTGYGFYAAGNAYFSGTLVSSSGKIGGFEISQYKMVNDSGNGNIIGICSTGGQEWAIWTGASKGANAPFHVGHNGYLYASNANISGVITATSGKIGGCDISNGKLVVPSANISGKLNASQIQIGDFTNYSDLTVDTYERYWFTLVPDGNNNPWFQCTPNRDITINPVSYDTYKCKGGETFKIEFEVSSTVKAANADGHGSNTYVDINVGLYCKNTKGESQWYIPYGTTSDAAGTVKTVSTQVTLGSSVRSFSVGIQCAGFAPFSGTLKIRNISVRRMADEALIVNGSITADKITANNISGTNGWINLRSGLFDYGNGKLKWDGKSLSIAGNGKFAGEITATSGKIGKYRINDYLITGSGSTCTGMGGNQAFWAGSDSSNNAPFHVSYDGSLYASKANISGVINSTDGSIGGWKISSNKLSAFKNGTHHDSSTGEDYDAEYYISLLSGKDEIPTIITSYEYYPPDEDWKYETIISPTEITCKESYAPPDSSDMGVCNSTVYSSNGITFYNGVKIDGLTKVLWEGADYMNGAQTALLDEKVLDQLNGIALVWSHYNISTHQASNSDVHVQFISKWCVGEMNGAGHAFIDPYRHIDKYFYVYNDKIVGSNINGTSGTEGGLSYDNRNCVLRAVIGV